MTLEEIEQKVNSVLPKGIEIANKNKKPIYAYGRYIFYATCDSLGYSKKESAKYLGFTHAAACKGIKVHKDLLEYDKGYQELYDRFKCLFEGVPCDIPYKIYKSIEGLSDKDTLEFYDLVLKPYLRVKGYED